MDPEVLVVGAGAAGITAAWRAATLGARVLVLEKTNRLGTKILISGGGKCNITHDGPLEEVLRAFRPEEARFIRPACYRFPPQEVVKLLTDRGLKVYTRPDGRIFPVDQTAKDVVRIFGQILDEAGARVRYETPVAGVVAEGGCVRGVRLADGTEVRCGRVIVGVGGSSYPNSGTTGDGFRWAKEVGHTVRWVHAALAPMYLAVENVKPERSGVALRDCVLRARQNGREVAKWRGDLLFTHHGVSGPNVLGVSRDVVERMADAPVELEADLRPGDPFELVTEELIAYAKKHPGRLVKSWVDEVLPASLVADFLAENGVDGEKPWAQFDKKSRNRLVNGVKGWKLGGVRAVPLEKGEVVAGGVSLDEVDPQTLESRLVRGLYWVGEVLDVAGPVGGYNLQAAWATGYVAGDHAATHRTAGA